MIYFILAAVSLWLFGVLILFVLGVLYDGLSFSVFIEAIKIGSATTILILICSGCVGLICFLVAKGL